MHDGTRLTRAGDGLGWSRLAEEVAKTVPAAEVDGIWVFHPIRNGPREWGTAIDAAAYLADRGVYLG